MVEHQIIRDHLTNRSRGFGFIIFENEESVDNLLVNGKMIDFSGTKVIYFLHSSTCVLFYVNLSVVFHSMTGYIFRLLGSFRFLVIVLSRHYTLRTLIDLQMCLDSFS